MTNEDLQAALVVAAGHLEQARAEIKRLQGLKDKDPEIPACNLCGEPCGCNHSEYPMGLIEHTVSGGYYSTPGNGSGALDDCSTYTFSLCEFCLDWLFSQCKIPPKVGHYSLGTGGTTEDAEPFRSAARRVDEDEWRRFKETFHKEAKRRNEARLAQSVYLSKYRVEK